MTSDEVPGSHRDVVTALTDRFPRLAAMPRDDLVRVLSRSRLMSVPAGTRMLGPGDACHGSPLLLEGELRVHTESAAGRGLTLYSVVPGQMCALTSLSLTSARPFPAYVDAVEDSTFIFVPPHEFTAMLGRDEGWRSYAFGQAWDRVDDLLKLLDSVLFTDLPTRLAEALLTAQHSGVITATHQRLAADIGSSREAVSRVLKRWEAAGTVRIERGRVDVIDAATLTRIAMH